MQYVSPAKTGIIAACQKRDLVKYLCLLQQKEKSSAPKGPRIKMSPRLPYIGCKQPSPYPKRAYHRLLAYKYLQRQLCCLRPNGHHRTPAHSFKLWRTNKPCFFIMGSWLFYPYNPVFIFISTHA